MFQKIIKADETGFTKFHKTPDGFAVQDYENLAPHVERCKAETLAGRDGRIMSADSGFHEASIPISKLAEWATAKGLQVAHVMRDDALLDKFLSDHPVFDLTRGRSQKYFHGA